MYTVFGETMSRAYMVMAGASRQGRRSANEDALLIDPARGIGAVCDGMGGRAGGAEAANLAVSALAAPFDADESQLMFLLHERVKQIDAEIAHVAKEHGLEGMGCACTAAMFTAYQYYISHIGDTRAYLVRDGQLLRLTRDHRFVSEMVERGEITQAQARTHPHRNRLTRVLGMHGCQPEIASGWWRRGDLMLLCSDGVHEAVSDEQFLEELTQPLDSLERLCNTILDRAERQGASDNLTAVIVMYPDMDVEDEPPTL